MCEALLVAFHNGREAYKTENEAKIHRAELICELPELISSQRALRPSSTDEWRCPSYVIVHLKQKSAVEAFRL
jgi:hypothetical protein